tara:strand:- start:362 stop:748 length:387 start_codon:yes stop_codon:yes gene_type:complete
MRKLLLLSTILISLIVSCRETIDDSQWKLDMEEKIKTLESAKDIPTMGMGELEEKISALESEVSKMSKIIDVQMMGDRVLNETLVNFKSDISKLEEANKELMNALKPTFESISRDINNLSKRIEELEK